MALSKSLLSEHLGNSKKKTTSKNKPQTKNDIEIKPKVTSNKNPGPKNPELQKLALNAKLEEQISKSQLAKYKVETAKLNLEKEAKNLGEFSFMDFLYLGYMEKINLDFLGMMQRLEPIIDNLVKEGNTPGIIKRVNKEIKSLLSDIKKKQAEDVKGFKSE